MNKPRNESELEKKVKILGRYTLAGFLPGKTQKKIAKKYNEDAGDYTFLSAATEGLVGIGICIAGINFPPLAIVGVIFYGDAALNILRCTASATTKKPMGHPITTIPYHMIKQPQKLGKYVKNKFSRGEKKV